MTPEDETTGQSRPGSSDLLEHLDALERRLVVRRRLADVKALHGEGLIDAWWFRSGAERRLLLEGRGSSPQG